MSAQVDGQANVTIRLEITLDEAHAPSTMTARTKEPAAVSRMHSPRAPFLAARQQSAQSRRGESTRETKNNDRLFAVLARAHLCVCVLLKIDSGISRALFIAVKAFNPFTSGFEQRLQAFGERG